MTATELRTETKPCGCVVQLEAGVAVAWQACPICDEDVAWLMHDSTDPADWPPGYGDAASGR